MLPGEKLAVKSTNILTYEDIAIENRGRNCCNEDFVFVSDSLNPNNSRLLIQPLCLLLIITRSTEYS
jgi:hypothetical protein